MTVTVQRQKVSATHTKISTNNCSLLEHIVMFISMKLHKNFSTKTSEPEESVIQRDDRHHFDTRQEFSNKMCFKTLNIDLKQQSYEYFLKIKQIGV